MNYFIKKLYLILSIIFFSFWNKNIMENNFSEFTGQYEISKTLRFELKPEGNTLNNLKADNVILKDREIQENYEKIKKYLDELHILFVEKSLENIDLSLLEDFYNIYLVFRKDSKDKKNKTNFEKISKDLRKELVSFFDAQWNIWKEKYNFLKKWWIWCLTEKEVLDLLKEFYPEESELFEKFKWFFTYFSNFNESRKNSYKDDWTASAIATRAIDENFTTFIENKIKFEEFLNNEENRDFIENNFFQEEKEIFNLDFYNTCLIQKWIKKYNEIIGWKSEENWNKIAWINEKINIYKQKENHSNSKDKKFPKFDLLYKQILSKQEKDDFYKFIESEKELFEILENSINENDKKINEAENIFKKFLDENNKYNLEEIYFSKQAVNQISNKFLENWDTLKNYLWKENSKKSYINFLDLKNSLNKIEEKNIFKDIYYKENVAFENKTNYDNFLAIFRFELFWKISEIKANKTKIIELSLKNFKRDKKQIEIIKKYLDSVLDLYKMTKYFNLEKNKKKLEKYDKDLAFYNDFDRYFIDFEIWKIYNLVRNYLSKKDIKTDKFKLNFENPQFLTGWDKDKEKERFWIILKKQTNFWKKYFLGILKKWNNNILEKYKYEWEENFYEKMSYKQLNNVYRQLPRLTFPLAKKLKKLAWEELEKYLQKYKTNFGFNDEIFKIKTEFDLFQKSKEKWEKFDLVKLKKLIKYYQNAVIFLYWDMYDLEDIKNNEYEELAVFYDDIEKKMYKLDFDKISENFINNLIENWDFYLFQIYNKDFSEYKKQNSNENIHTKYFKLLFSEENLQNLKIKLSWWAEIFFRDKTKNLKQKNKIIKKAEFENEKDITEKMFYIDKKTGEKKEVLEHRRYWEDKIMFHISITLNANCGDKYKFNDFINKKLITNNFLDKNKEINIIWIDRWEKHLAYYSVIDKNWKILEIDTLNTINKVNYLEKLEEKEKSRASWRLNWWEIENIKNLKDGYISQVVNKLAELIVKHNAIIVFEDLNSWFKRWRQKIEKQVYQKLELALAKKLNYLTFKNKKNWELWWYLNWLQFVQKVNDYQDIWRYKQSGIIFYTNPAYTSATCPKCAWRKMLKFPQKLNKDNIKKFFEKIEINYNSQEKKFSFTYSILTEKNIWKKKIKEKKEYTIFSNVFRNWYDRKKKETLNFDMNEKFLDLFIKNNFNLEENINKQIEEKNLDWKFLDSLLFYFKLLNNIRNSNTKEDKDIISCPQCWYNSENWFQWKTFNWDANWAYNIARKWIIILDRIEQNWEKPDLFISDYDWDSFCRR